MTDSESHLTATHPLFSNSSSESDMEEEDEQEDQDQEEVEADQQPTSPSDLGGVPWKDAVELHAKLRANQEGEGEVLADAVSRDGEVDEDEEEDEDEDDEESSDGNFFFHSWCDYNVVHVKTVNVVCFLWFVCTPCPDFCPSQNSTCFFIKVCFMCCVTVSNIVLLILCFFPPFPSPPLLYFPSMSTVFVCVYACICVHFFWGICLPLLAEGDYCPWDSELQSGRWLEKYLTDEEDVGTFKGSSRSACGCVCSNFERDN